jgi:RNAse (barnase) inhibitor barstar
MSKKSLRQLRLPSGLAKVDELRDELDDFMDVLMGRVDPPIDNGPMTLMEFANAAYSRAVEITMLIQRGEADGFVQKNSAHYRFRTGELRNFVELATKAIDLGSRRVTASKMAYEQEYG